MKPIAKTKSSWWRGLAVHPSVASLGANGSVARRWGSAQPYATSRSFMSPRSGKFRVARVGSLLESK